MPLFFFWVKFPFSFLGGSCIIKDNGFPMKIKRENQEHRDQKERMQERLKKWNRQKLQEWFPVWAILPLLSILLLNCIVYWGGAALTSSRYHFDFTTGLDRAVPLLPSFVWIYILAFPFWAANYLMAARRGKEIFYRFVATDLLVHISCFVIFLAVPTTNLRPEIAGNTLSEKVLLLVYAMDGGSAPSNLLPSIHCYVSWLCYRGLKGAREIPVWYQRFSLVFASLIVVSTQVLKQHYLVDAVAGILLVELAWHFFQKRSRYRKIMEIYETINQKQMGEEL